MGKSSASSTLSGLGTSLLRRAIFKAGGLSRLQHPWPSHNIRNPSPCLIGWVLPQRGPLPPSLKLRRTGPPGHQSLSLLRRADYGVLCEVMAVRPREGVCLLRRMNKEGSLAGVAPARPQLRTTLTPSLYELRRAGRPNFSAPPSLTTSLPPVGRVSSMRRLLASRCPSRHPRSARSFVPRPGLRHHVPASSTS